jgi:hypothetical protein
MEASIGVTFLWSFLDGERIGSQDHPTTFSPWSKYLHEFPFDYWASQETIESAPVMQQVTRPHRRRVDYTYTEKYMRSFMSMQFYPTIPRAEATLCEYNGTLVFCQQQKFRSRVLDP